MASCQVWQSSGWVMILLPSAMAQRIRDSFGKTGITVTMIELEDTVSRPLFQSELSRLNVLPEIAAIIVQQPLPPQIDLETIVGAIDPAKDVDGIHPVNAGRLMLGLDCYVPATRPAEWPFSTTIIFPSRVNALLLLGGAALWASHLLNSCWLARHSHCCPFAECKPAKPDSRSRDTCRGRGQASYG